MLWGIEDGANQYQNAAAADSDSFHQNGKLNSSHSAPKTRRFTVGRPRVYINNIEADRIVRCVRVMMSTHWSECFDCKSTLDRPNGAEGIPEIGRKRQFLKCGIFYADLLVFPRLTQQ